MYIQQRYHFHRWWVDLRAWDSLGRDRSLVIPEITDKDGMSPTTEMMLSVYEMFVNHIPF